MVSNQRCTRGVRMGRLGAVVRLKKNAPSSAYGAGAFPSFRVSRPGGLRERIAEHLAVEHIASGIRRIYTKRMLISARSSALTVRGGFLKWFGIDESRDYYDAPLRKTVGSVLIALAVRG